LVLKLIYFDLENKMNMRHSFLALALSILSLSFKIASAAVADYDYVVIGGGVSGLAACVELIKNGVPVGKIKLLEANDHLGGRIESQPFSKITFFFF